MKFSLRRRHVAAVVAAVRAVPGLVRAVCRLLVCHDVSYLLELTLRPRMRVLASTGLGSRRTMPD